jgi:hypothetical protein
MVDGDGGQEDVLERHWQAAGAKQSQMLPKVVPRRVRDRQLRECVHGMAKIPCVISRSRSVQNLCSCHAADRAVS